MGTELNDSYCYYTLAQTALANIMQHMIIYDRYANVIISVCMFMGSINQFNQNTRYLPINYVKDYLKN